MLYEPTCEICGHHIEDDICEYCRNIGDNGKWIEKIIEQARDPRHDQSAFKDKKNDKQKFRQMEATTTNRLKRR